MRRAHALAPTALLLLLWTAACGDDGGGTQPPPPPVDPGPAALRDGLSLYRSNPACAAPLPCEGYVQVLWDGWLRAEPLDRAAVTDSVLLEPETVEAVRSLALENATIEMLKRGDAGCEAGTLVERLELRHGPDRFVAKISGCADGPGAALRDSLLALARRHLP